MSPPDFRLDGRTALVTGASGGLGSVFARTLHAAGAQVVLAARRVDRIEALAAELGQGALAVAMDVSDVASVAGGFDAAQARFGPVHVVVNNSGVSGETAAHLASEAEWDAVMDVNLKGAWLVAREAANRLIAAGEAGAIVNVTSILGERVSKGVAAYAASKAGLAQLTRAMALELARHRIRVNALAPGYVATDISAAWLDSPGGQAMVRTVPMRRLGQAEELAGPLLLLCSDAGSWMTGATLVADGGHLVSSL